MCANNKCCRFNGSVSFCIADCVSTVCVCVCVSASGALHTWWSGDHSNISNKQYTQCVRSLYHYCNLFCCILSYNSLCTLFFSLCMLFNVASMLIAYICSLSCYNVEQNPLNHRNIYILRYIPFFSLSTYFHLHLPIFITASIDESKSSASFVVHFCTATFNWALRITEYVSKRWKKPTHYHRQLSSKNELHG